MKLSGSQAEISRFIDECCGKYVPGGPWIDLEKSVPPPAHLLQGGHLAPSDEGKSWALQNWGVDFITDQRVIHHDDETLELVYSSPWGPPYVFNESLAQRFPEIRINIVCYEDGNDFGYRFSAHGGAAETIESGADEAIIREVEGSEATNIPSQLDIDEMRAGTSARLAALSQAPRVAPARKRGFFARLFGR